MANEITVSARLQVTKGGIAVDRNVVMRSSMTGTHLSQNIQNIGTTYEQVTIGSDVATNGKAFFRNQDATNYCEIGLQVSSTFYPFCKLKPMEVAVLGLSPVAIYARANTAATDLEVIVIED